MEGPAQPPAASMEWRHKQNIAEAQRLATELARRRRRQRAANPSRDDRHPLSVQADAIVCKSFERVLAAAGARHGGGDGGGSGGGSNGAGAAASGRGGGTGWAHERCPKVVSVHHDGHTCRLSSFHRILGPQVFAPRQVGQGTAATATASAAYGAIRTSLSSSPALGDSVQLLQQHQQHQQPQPIRAPVKSLRDLRDEACRYWGREDAAAFYVALAADAPGAAAAARAEPTAHSGSTGTAAPGAGAASPSLELWPLHASVTDVAARCQKRRDAAAGHACLSGPGGARQPQVGGGDPHYDQSWGGGGGGDDDEEEEERPVHLVLLYTGTPRSGAVGSAGASAGTADSGAVALTRSDRASAARQRQRVKESAQFLAYAAYRKRVWTTTYGLLLVLLAVISTALQQGFYRPYDPAIMVAQAYQNQFEAAAQEIETEGPTALHGVGNFLTEYADLVDVVRLGVATQVTLPDMVSSQNSSGNENVFLFGSRVQLAQVRVPLNVACDLGVPLAVSATGLPWPNSSVCAAPWTVLQQQQYVTPVALVDNPGALALPTTTAGLPDLTNATQASVWTYSNVVVGMEPAYIFQHADGSYKLYLDANTRLDTAYLADAVAKYSAWVDYQTTEAVSANFVILNADVEVQMHRAFTLRRDVSGDYQTTQLLLTLPLRTEQLAQWTPIITLLLATGLFVAVASAEAFHIQASLAVRGQLTGYWRSTFAFVILSTVYVGFVVTQAVVLSMRVTEQDFLAPLEEDEYPPLRMELDEATQQLLLFLFVQGVILLGAFVLVVTLLAQARRLSLLRRAVGRLFVWQALALLAMVVLVVLLVRVCVVLGAMTSGTGAPSTRTDRPWALLTTTFFGSVPLPSLAALFRTSRGGSPISFLVNAVLWFFLYLVVRGALVGMFQTNLARPASHRGKAARRRNNNNNARAAWVLRGVPPSRWERLRNQARKVGLTLIDITPVPAPLVEPGFFQAERAAAAAAAAAARRRNKGTAKVKTE